MRKIEQQMCEAIQANKNWSNANTSVIFDSETNNSNVYLHGNLIATVTDTDMTIYDGGHQTVTTKSRLNALCDYFCIEGERVYQKNFQWYVDKLVGESSITGKVFNTYEFVNGFTFAWCSKHYPNQDLQTNFSQFTWKLLLLLSSVFSSGTQRMLDNSPQMS